MPLMRPLCALRNLVRIGCSMAALPSYPSRVRSGHVAARPSGVAFRELLVLRHRVVLHDLALEDPDLHAARPIGRKCRRNTVVHIRAQSVQGHAAFPIPFHAGNLGPAQAPRAVDANAAGTKAHRRLHRPLHRAAKRNPPLELLRDRLGYQLGIKLRLPDLHDVDHHVRFREIGDLPAQLLDVRALLSDDNARPRRLHRDATFLVRPLDDDLGDRRLLEILHQLLADLHVLVQKLPVLVLAGVPARIPGAIDAEPQADWIDLLTHGPTPKAPSYEDAGVLSRTTMVRFANGFKIRPILPRPRG